VKKCLLSRALNIYETRLNSAALQRRGTCLVVETPQFLKTSLHQHSRRHYLLLDVPLQYLHQELA